MMQLTLANPGDSGKVKKVSGPEQVRQHLGGLGFVEGADVTVISKIAGNVIVQVKDSRIALDKKMASRIFFILN